MPLSNLPENSTCKYKQSVLVTGASSGIGFSIAMLLSNAGFLVYAGIRKALDKQKLELLGKGNIIAVTLDISSDIDIVDTVKLIKSNHHSTLIALVNNAGICETNLMSDCSRAELLNLFNINAVSHLMLSNAVLPLLQDACGVVINIGSTSSVVPSVLNGAYCASKAALEMFSKIMRIEYSVKGVRVVSIQPGVVATPFWIKVANSEITCRIMKDKTHVVDDKFDSRQILLRAYAENGKTHPDEISATVLNIINAKYPRQNYVIGADAKRRLFMFNVIPAWLYNLLAIRKFKS